MLEARLTATWAILVGLTVGGFLISSLHHAGLGFALVMLAAALKARLIVREYMDVRHLPRTWRVIFDAQIALAVASIAGLHLLPYMEFR